MERHGKKNLKAVQVGKDWYSVEQDRGKWSSAWNQTLAEHQIVQQRGWTTGEKNVLCDVCGRRFRKENDKAHLKCTAERRQLCEQEGAVPCEECKNWIRSRGWLAVDRYRSEELVEDDATGGMGAHISLGQVEYRKFDRTFSKQGDLKRHKCLN